MMFLTYTFARMRDTWMGEVLGKDYISKCNKRQQKETLQAFFEPEA